MGRPSTGCLSSFSEPVRNEIDKLKENQPGWSALTILTTLHKSEKWNIKDLPSKTTINQYFKEKEQTRIYERHEDLPIEAVKKAKHIHSLWQIDGQGNTNMENIGAIAMLNIVDVVSKVYTSSFPAKMTSMQGHPNRNDYQTALRLGFSEFGRPLRVQSDHASVFFDNGHKSPFPTRFFLWLTALDIAPLFSRVHRPTDQGQVEKSHQTIENQVIKGRQYKNWQHLFEETQKRRCFLNNDQASSACQDLAPLQSKPEAKHSGRHYHPHQEYDMLDMDKVDNFLAKSKWYRKVAGNRTITIGGHYYYIPNTKPREQLLITFCKEKRELLFQNDKELEIARIPIKGMNKEALMGDLDCFAKFPSLQLKIPFEWKDAKIDTTFSVAK